jgi:RimJ/RimL family protein N-acetyltransferase
MTTLIKGKKINLRVVVQADAESITKYARNPAVSRMTHMPYPYKLEHAREFIRRYQRVRRKGKMYMFGIEQKETGKIIGGISLGNVNAKQHRAELGFWLGKPFWGQGIVSEAVAIMVEFGFKRLRLRRILAMVFHHNPASMKVLEKNGFVREGVLRQWMHQRGTLIDLHMFGILKEDYRTAQKRKRK